MCTCDGVGAPEPGRVQVGEGRGRDDAVRLGKAATPTHAAATLVHGALLLDDVGVRRVAPRLPLGG